jgi:hypothetical protein
MKTSLRLVLGVVAILGLTLALHSEEKKDKEKKKEETLKGTIVCTKCELGETDDCGNAIKVKFGDKNVVFYILDKGKAEKYHDKFCTAPAKGSVTGVVSEKDKKKYITPSKNGVKFD